MVKRLIEMKRSFESQSKWWISFLKIIKSRPNPIRRTKNAREQYQASPTSTPRKFPVAYASVALITIK